MSNLIFDIGLHKGEDTLYFLSQGFEVVAVEANMNLVNHCQDKFSDFIESGRLHIIHGAIADSDQQFVSFFENERSEWGTVRPDWAERNFKLGTKSRIVKVPVIKVKDLLAKFGCPLYVKIDIEGLDLFCLKEIASTEFRPKFISIESEKREWLKLEEELQTLRSMGYSKFFIQNMARISKIDTPSSRVRELSLTLKFPKGSSGPFGEDLGSVWLTHQEALDSYRKIFRKYRLFGDFSFLRKLPFRVI